MLNILVAIGIIIVSCIFFYLGDEGVRIGRRRYILHNAWFTGLVGILFGIYLIGATIWTGISGIFNPTNLATAIPFPTANIYSTPTSESDIFLPLTQAASTHNAIPNCFRWDQITAAMKGQRVCVRGVIYNFIQTRKVGTRYEFSDKPNSFFIFSASWEVIDPNTGKTLGPGVCIEATDVIQVESGVPYINIDRSIKDRVFTDLKFDNNPSSCK
jgi:hypothetical protein